jgi:hypothetical protein
MHFRFYPQPQHECRYPLPFLMAALFYRPINSPLNRRIFPVGDKFRLAASSDVFQLSGNSIAYLCDSEEMVIMLE